MLRSEPASRFRLAGFLCAVLPAALIMLLPGQAQAQATPPPAEAWELRVCADADNLPYSNRSEEGFENAIASLLAEQLGAALTYAWMPEPARDTDAELMIRMGFCDLMLGVPDGQEPFLTTVAYYRSTAVFVTRSDAPFEITSLDDEILQDLRIGVQRGSPADYSLLQRGMLDNVQHFLPADPPDAIVRQVADGTLDVGITLGATAGHYAGSLDLPVVLTPVTPEIDMPFLQLTQPITIGVRSTDEAFRDLLDDALAQHWDEIQALIADFGVPLPPLSPPMRGVAPEPGVRIGVVVPALTGPEPLQPLGPEFTGEPARQGALLAEEAFADDPALPLYVPIASAPSPEAAVRAARRLVAAQGVTALVGGVGPGQAEVLAELAGELQVLFLNIGSPAEQLRSAACYPTTFSVEASSGMYLKALATMIATAGVQDWFVIQADSPVWAGGYRELAELLGELIPGGNEAGHSLVAAGAPLFVNEFDEVRQSGADAVILLLDADSQLVFLGQYETAGVDAAAFAFPVGLTQSRQFYSALLQDAPVTGSGPRIALWDASLQDGDAAALNERFLARWGSPMDPAAWAAYAAIRIVFEAAAAGGQGSAELIAQLEQSQSGFTAGKEALSFDSRTRQLLQPLYAVQPDPAADLGRSASRRLDLARVVATIPAQPVASVQPEVCPGGQ